MKLYHVEKIDNPRIIVNSSSILPNFVSAAYLFRKKKHARVLENFMNGHFTKKFWQVKPIEIPKEYIEMLIKVPPREIDTMNFTFSSYAMELSLAKSIKK